MNTLPRSEPLKSVCVVGGGSAGWMVAAALAENFSGSGLAISLIESEDIGTVGVGEATIPHIMSFQQSLGIDVGEFVNATHATFKLGIEFVDWGGLGERYFHTFGGVGQDLGLVPFHHHWARARSCGQAQDIGRYSLQTLACHQGRFAATAAAPGGPVQSVAHAVHFDAVLYAAYLRRYAEQRGVRRWEGRIADVVLEGAGPRVSHLRTQDGRELSADLFIDCTGFAALLIGKAQQVPFEDWSAYLPCDRAWAVPCERRQPLTPYTRATAREAGWQWRIPLQHRVGNGHVFSSAFMDEQRALDILMENLEGPPLAPPRLLRFKTGKRARQWHGNVVAMGLASGFMEPLESTSLYLVQASIARLLSLFPGRGMDGTLMDEFNRQTDDEWTRIRNFLVLHYHLTRRDDSAMWRYCRTMDVPLGMQQALERFIRTGCLVRDPMDLFTESSWLQVLLGQGAQPAQWHPLTRTLKEEESAWFVEQVRKQLEAAVSAMPTHEETLRSLVDRAHTPKQSLNANR